MGLNEHSPVALDEFRGYYSRVLNTYRKPTPNFSRGTAHFLNSSRSDRLNNRDTILLLMGSDTFDKGHQFLADNSGLSPRTVGKHIKALIADGTIEVIDQGHNQPTAYSVVRPREFSGTGSLAPPLESGSELSSYAPIVKVPIQKPAPELDRNFLLKEYLPVSINSLNTVNSDSKSSDPGEQEDAAGLSTVESPRTWESKSSDPGWELELREHYSGLWQRLNPDPGRWERTPEEKQRGLEQARINLIDRIKLLALDDFNNGAVEILAEFEETREFPWWRAEALLKKLIRAGAHHAGLRMECEYHGDDEVWNPDYDGRLHCPGHERDEDERRWDIPHSARYKVRPVVQTDDDYWD